MRKRIKTKIIDILNTLGKAHQHVELLLQKGMVQEAADMLAKCQECALEAGSTIEKSDGMGTKAVSGLEEYCELLYQMSQAADRKAVKNLKRQIDGVLRKVERSLEELPLEPVKVVFMPYKASMWDCLESIWEAADADKDCIAYVVPIPFVEKNAQGGVEKECYEGDMFPKEVPIIHYSQFSLEQEEPEIIYIHNPYDNGNYVTSVYPEYYSFQLKKYTDMLVYVPYYFGGNGPMPDGHQDLPVYHYADKIILQDKEKVESLADESLRAKAVAMGSPKVDRVLKLEKRRDEIIEKEICAEWREKIRGKKVILYNISVSGILQNSEYAMEKIRYVLSRFRGRDDVVLWWRPHPLIEGTLKSMRPKLYGEYMQIKNAFLREGKGILDESGDAGVAAVVADAYLGEDTSSLVHYFGVLGKPVMFTDWRMVEEEKKDRDFIYFHVFFKEGNSIFFVPANPGYAHDLYQLEMESGVVKKVLTFPGTAEYVWACYRGIKKIQNKIILVPYNTEDLYIYDLMKKQAVKIVLPTLTDKIMHFGGLEEYNGNLFLLPVSYPAIIKVNMQNLQLDEYKECIGQVLSEDKDERKIISSIHNCVGKDVQNGEKNEILFLWGYYRKDQYLYLVSAKESKIIIFNMEDCSYKIKNIGNYEFGYSHIIFDGEYFWLSAYNTNYVVRWDEYSETVKQYEYPIEGKDLVDGFWSSLFDNKNELIICCGTCINIIVMDKTTGKCQTNKEVKDELYKIKKETIDKNRGFGCVQRWDNETAIFLNMGNSTVYLWNGKTGKWKRILCNLPQREMLEAEKKWIKKYAVVEDVPYCLKENMVSIPQFIDYICWQSLDVFKQKYLCYQGEGNRDVFGTDIHNYIKGEIS